MTLAVHRRALAKQIATPEEPLPLAPKQLELLRSSPSPDDDEAEESEAEVAADESAAVEAATVASATTVASSRELELLDQMSEIAEAARGQTDSRLERLIAWIRKNLCPEGPRWNSRRVLIFTEYGDTKRYLEAHLNAAFSGTDRAEERIRTFHGGMGDERREEIKRAFNADPIHHPLRILIATDAAREGVNLQNHCADLFHFDVPWNPSRMEQRNGRIDRKLQRSPEVRCHYFVLVQRPEDKVLKALITKGARIERELGSLSPVLERRLEVHIGERIRHDSADRVAQAIENETIGEADRIAVEEELEAVRERRAGLAAQLDKLRDMLETSQNYLNLDSARFRSAVSASLEILANEPLVPDVAASDGSTVADRPDPPDGYRVSAATSPAERFRFPALDRRLGGDPSWAPTLDLLRSPKREGEKPWQWRRDAPIRPVVFEAPDGIDDEVVQLHLEHRLVRRLLGRFVSQGFVHDDISRACVSQSRDAIPRVLLLGRLSLYGERATRLHDEVVAVAARWIDPEQRRGPLRPYAERAEERSLALVDEQLVSSRVDAVPESVRRKLAESAARDAEELLVELNARARAIADRANLLLAERGEREAKEMREILQQQRARIEATKARFESPQLELDFDTEERRQLDADRRHWSQRLLEISDELEREPERVRAGYVVKATRVEPIGLVYLWPVSG
jgi:hypothetical protein